MNISYNIDLNDKLKFVTHRTFELFEFSTLCYSNSSPTFLGEKLDYVNQLLQNINS